MRLRNVLIAVNDMDRAIRFYKEIFGLQVILDPDGNLIEVGTPVTQSVS